MAERILDSGQRLRGVGDACGGERFEWGVQRRLPGQDWGRVDNYSALDTTDAERDARADAQYVTSQGQHEARVRFRTVTYGEWGPEPGETACREREELVVGGMVWSFSPEGFLTVRGMGYHHPRPVGVLQTPEELELLAAWLHRLAQDQQNAEEDHAGEPPRPVRRI